MSSKKQTIYLYTLSLLVVYPILFLYALNIRSVRIVDIFQSLLNALLLAVISLLIFRLFVKSWIRAALMAAIFCLLFLSFGHLLQPFNNLSVKLGLPKNYSNYLFLGIWVLILIIAFWGINRLKNPVYAAKVLSIVGLVLVGFSLFNIVSFHWQNRNTAEANKPQLGSNLDLTIDTLPNLATLPDIYYVILDGYGRSDMLQSVYNYDNSAFIQELEDVGFFVADESNTNYNRTILSLASSMNMSYLDEFAEAEGRQSTRYALFDNLISNGQVMNFLERFGYDTVVISSGYQSTEFNKNAEYRSSQASFISEFERLVLQQTPFNLIPAFNQFLSYEAHRNRVLFSLAEMGKLAEERKTTPRFIFAHIISPHPPFVFGPQGEKLNPGYAYYLGDAKDFRGTQEEYLSGYADQLHYLNQELMKTVTEIIDSSDIPPIIILQGDHGPGAFSDFSSMDSSCLYERASILNAYYFPQEKNPDLYASITPVNSFRVIFDTYFGTSLGLLDDNTYFGEMPHLLDVVDITDSIRETNCR